LGVDLRGGIEAKKLSLRTKVVGRIHFAKPKNSHEVNTVLYAGSSVFLSTSLNSLILFIYDFRA
jgi:hypothetical protein